MIEREREKVALHDLWSQIERERIDIIYRVRTVTGRAAHCGACDIVIVPTLHFLALQLKDAPLLTIRVLNIYLVQLVLRATLILHYIRESL